MKAARLDHLSAFARWLLTRDRDVAVRQWSAEGDGAVSEGLDQPSEPISHLLRIKNTHAGLRPGQHSAGQILLRLQDRKKATGHSAADDIVEQVDAVPRGNSSSDPEVGCLVRVVMPGIDQHQ